MSSPVFSPAQADEHPEAGPPRAETASCKTEKAPLSARPQTSSPLERGDFPATPAAGGEKTPSLARPKKRAAERLKKMFAAKRLALMAVFAALAYVVSFLEFPLFPSVSFLKLDFGNVFIMLIGFLLGPVEGVIVCVLKEVLRIPLGSTGGVGELANMIVTSSFILLPSVVYQFHKGLKIVIPALAAACVIATGAALLANRFILFPAFGIPTEGFNEVWGFILAFNLVKTAAVSLLTLLLYKRLSAFLKKMKI